MVKVGINGFGRIGRIAFRVGLLKHSKEIDFVAINTSGSMDVAGWAHLANYDTTYRKFEKEVKAEEVRKPDQITDKDPLIGYFKVGGKKIPVLAQRDPAKLPWKKYGVEVVIESTGKFATYDEARKHLDSGAKKVVISAPGKGGDIETYLLGVKKYNGKDRIISNSSCTTNCIAPVVAVLQEKFGIAKAAMTTVHAYTDDQNLQDGSHKDLRRARAAAANIIPTSTGAAISVTEVIPAIKGLFDGKALRVPVVTGSITDMAFVLKKGVTVEEINKVFEEASKSPQYKGILAVTQEPVVSSDIIGRSESSIVDLSLTQVVGGNLVKVFSWYDNEWGYAHRLIEQVVVVGKTISSK
jgi:glyceraldehyde 3-phosphate dehydrogenase